MRMYQRFCSSRAEKCECINVFAHRKVKSVNVSMFALIENGKVRMYQGLCSAKAEKCKCINVFAHQKLKRANVTALSFIEN